MTARESMSKAAEFTAEDFKPVFKPPMGDDDLEFISERANRLLPEILAPYIDDLKAAREALNSIAEWGSGAEVGGHFDSPGDAKTARQALAAQKVKF